MDIQKWIMDIQKLGVNIKQRLKDVNFNLT